MKNSTYDVLKGVSTIGLPAAATAYAGLAEIWDWPHPEKVTGSAVVLVTFLGVLLRIISNQYYSSDAPYDGKIVTTHDSEGNTNYSLELGVPPEDIENMSAVAFQVTEPPPFTGDITDDILPDHGGEEDQ